VDPATKSVFRSRRFDPAKAQFDLLNNALNGTEPDQPPVKGEDLVVVPASPDQPAAPILPASSAVAVPLVVQPTIDVAPLPPLPIETATLTPAKSPDFTPEPVVLAQKVETPPPLPPAPLLPPLLPVAENKADLLPKKAAKPESKPEITAEIEKMTPKKSSRPPLRIVLDPGHGGRDPGTGSEIDVTEKEINLEFAIALANLLEDDPNYEVFLTRETDIRVKLRKRVEFARRKDADLFISIHADWSLNKRAKGATAYTLSEEASVEALDDLATKRDKGGKVAGVDLAAERADVARLLVDLARRETQARSLKFAELVVGEVAKETPVLRRPLRKDSFHVLKAPDMPSVLLELGFLSNETDRKRLQSTTWRLKTANAVKRAIDEFRHVTGARDFANR